MTVVDHIEEVTKVIESVRNWVYTFQQSFDPNTTQLLKD